eukprot:5159851-Pleurochrysis_carterae.AAC.1
MQSLGVFSVAELDAVRGITLRELDREESCAALKFAQKRLLMRLLQPLSPPPPFAPHPSPDHLAHLASVSASSVGNLLSTILNNAFHPQQRLRIGGAAEDSATQQEEEEVERDELRRARA